MSGRRGGGAGSTSTSATGDSSCGVGVGDSKGGEQRCQVITVGQGLGGLVGAGRHRALPAVEGLRLAPGGPRARELPPGGPPRRPPRSRAPTDVVSIGVTGSGGVIAASAVASTLAISSSVESACLRSRRTSSAMVRASTDRCSSLTAVGSSGRRLCTGITRNPSGSPAPPTSPGISRSTTSSR